MMAVQAVCERAVLTPDFSYWRLGNSASNPLNLHVSGVSQGRLFAVSEIYSLQMPLHQGHRDYADHLNGRSETMAWIRRAKLCWRSLVPITRSVTGGNGADFRRLLERDQIGGSGWRRGRDSNPRYPQRHNGFRDRPVRPLRHLSEREGGVWQTRRVKSSRFRRRAPARKGFCALTLQHLPAYTPRSAALGSS